MPRLFLVYCLLTSVGSQTALVPQNVSLSWNNGLYPKLTWNPPTSSVDSCTYQVFVTHSGDEESKDFHDVQSPWCGHFMMNGGFLNVSVQAMCGGIKTQPAVIIYNDPDLVKDLVCFIVLPNVTHCSWRPSVHTPPDLRFFYDLADDDVVSNDLPPLQECPSYMYTDGARTGCELQVKKSQSMHALFNGTVGKASVRNSHDLGYLQIRAPPLKWTVKETKEEFHIRWTPPPFHDLSWKYYINYTGCNQNTVLPKEGTSTEIKRLPKCAYSIRMRAVVEQKAETEWTPYKSFEADSVPNPVLWAVVLVPLFLAALALPTFYFCMKNKDKIFPKVPEPRFLVSDISDNNNKINVPNLYFPKEEECHVTLVTDPKLKL